MESTHENLPERLMEFHRLGKDQPSALIVAPLVEAAEEINRLREALVRIQKLTDKLDEDDHAYNDVDELQLFENEVMVIVELALSENRN